MWPYPWTHVGTPSHLGHMDRVAATRPSQAHAGAAQEASDIGQLEEQDVPLVRPSSCNVKGGIPSCRRYLPTLAPFSLLGAGAPHAIASFRVGCSLRIPSYHPCCVPQSWRPLVLPVVLGGVHIFLRVGGARGGYLGLLASPLAAALAVYFRTSIPFGACGDSLGLLLDPCVCGHTSRKMSLINALDILMKSCRF